MLEVAEIIRLHGAAYLARFADRILPSHRRALRDLEACRTPALGGHVHQCDHCGREVRVSLLPQSSLLKVSPRPDRALVNGAARPVAALRLLLTDLHPA